MTRAPRDLTWPAYLAVVVAYLVIIQGLGTLLQVDTHGADSEFPTAEAVLRGGVIPIALSVVFGVAVVTWLRWWPEILRDERPVQPWVRRVPVTMIVVALLATNYGHLAHQDAGLVVSLVALVAVVGVGEELMFRGLGVVTFRARRVHGGAGGTVDLGPIFDRLTPRRQRTAPDPGTEADSSRLIHGRV